MVRPNEKSSARSKERSSRGRRVAAKEDRSQSLTLCGWNLPALPDDNDIITWSSREQNGDNNRKAQNAVYEEEQFRHVTGLCDAIEDRVLFDRQSLHPRYLTHCQYGLQAPPTATPPVPPTDNLDDGATLVVESEEGEEEEEEEEGTRTSREGRSASAMCLRDSLEAMTGDEGSNPLEACLSSRRLRADEDIVYDEEEEEGGWDEGYGSKVSSNEQDGGEESLGGLNPQFPQYTFPKHSAFNHSGHIPVHKMPSVLTTQRVAQPEGVAKLLFPRQGFSDCERQHVPLRAHSLQYIGKSPAGLTESNRRTMSPAYLARCNHLADLAKMALSRQTRQDKRPQGKPPKEAEESGNGNTEQKEENGQSKTVVLHKITIQDSGKDLFSQQVQSARRAVSCAARTFQVLTQPFDRVHRKRAHSERIALERKSALSADCSRTELSIIPATFSSPLTKASSKTVTAPGGDGTRACVSAMTVSEKSDLTLPITSDTRKTTPPDKTLKILDLTSDVLSRDSSNTTAPSGVSVSRALGKMIETEVKEEVGVKFGEVGVKTENVGVKVGDVGVKVGDVGVKTEDIGVKAEDFGVKVGDVGVKTDDIVVKARETESSGSTCSGRLCADNTLPMLDLLPALETSLHIHRATQRILNKCRTIDVSSTLNSITLPRHHNHNPNHSHTQHRRGVKHLRSSLDSRGDSDPDQQVLNQDQDGWEQSAKSGGEDGGGGGGMEDLTSSGAEGEDVPVSASIITVITSQTTSSDDVRCFPAFRAHHITTPLHRAKDNSERRIHGHSSATLMDGSETVRYSSPRFTQPRSGPGFPRIRSASRLVAKLTSAENM